MRKHIILCSAGVYATLLLVLGSCGGGGGGGSSTFSDDTVPNTLESIVEQQNRQADQFVSNSIAHRTAVEEYIGAFKSAFPGVDPSQSSGEDLYNYLGAEKAASLLAELQTINDEKIVPSLAAARKMGTDLIASEQQIEQMLVGSPDTYSESHELLATRAILTTSVCVATAGLVGTAGATAFACYDNFKAEFESCLARIEGSQAGNPVADQIYNLQCLPSFLNGLESCGISIAEGVAWFLASIGTVAWAPVQIIVDYGSAASSTSSVMNVLGRKRSEKRSISGDAIEIIEVVPVVSTDPEPVVTSFVARSENGTVQMPAGNWDLTVFSAGYARQTVYDVEVPRFGGDTGIQVSMIPSSDLQYENCDAQFVPDASDDPMEVTALTTTDDARTGQPVGVSVIVKGGTPPYSYQWYAPDADVPTGSTTDSDGTASFVFSSTGVFQIDVTITDSPGFILTSATTVTVAESGETPTEPMWDNDCGYDNVLNTGGATAIWSMGDPVPYTGRGLICSDRNNDLWLKHNGVVGNWHLVDDIGWSGSHPTWDDCYAQPAVALVSGAVIGGDWICPL